MLREETIRGALAFLLIHERNRLLPAQQPQQEYIDRLMREMGWEEMKPVPPPSESGTGSTCETTEGGNGVKTHECPDCGASHRIKVYKDQAAKQRAYRGRKDG